MYHETFDHFILMPTLLILTPHVTRNHSRFNATPLLSLLFLLGIFCCQTAFAATNFIVVVVDGFSQDTIDVWQNPTNRLPGLRKLASSGTMYTNAYASGSGFAPVWASLLEGRSALSTGFLADENVAESIGPRRFSPIKPTPFPDDQSSAVARLLADRNYQTVFEGSFTPPAKSASVEKFLVDPTKSFAAFLTIRGDLISARNFENRWSRIQLQLAKKHLETNTVVIITGVPAKRFSEDALNMASVAYRPFNGQRGHLYDGGLRVPLIVTTPLGGVRMISSRWVVTEDITATILSMAKASALPAAGQGRGLDANDDRSYYVWHQPSYGDSFGEPASAIRKGAFKLIRFYEWQRDEMFNLQNDPGERNNLAGREGVAQKELSELLDAELKHFSAPMMTPNTHFPTPITPQASGVYRLHARDAKVKATMMHYEPQPHKNTLGSWGKGEDGASWSLATQAGGEFTVEVLQGCGSGNGGCTIAIEAAGQEVTFVVEETGNFQNFTRRNIGTIKLPAQSNVELSVKVKKKPTAYVMDLRQIRLIPK